MKIGILGSENSHALNFAKFVNIAGENGLPYPDVRVTHVFGFDTEQAKKTAEAGRVEIVATDPNTVLDETDAIMIVFRDGKYHYRYAMEALRRNKPVWVDKPLAIDPQEALTLVREAKKRGIPLSGGSCCKWTSDVIALRDKVRSGEVKPITAMLNFPVMLNSEYSGIHFYASHLVEMTAEIFGYAIRKVYAHRKGDGVTAVFEYNDKNVVLSFVNSSRYSCYIIEADKNTVFEIDTSSGLAALGIHDFMQAIRTGKPQNPPIDLYRCTVLVNAVQAAMESGMGVEPVFQAE